MAIARCSLPGLFAYALAFALAACAPAPNAAPPLTTEPASPPGSAPRASAAPLDAAASSRPATPSATPSAAASASSSAAPPAPPPLLADGPFVGLFTKDKQLVYIVTDEVDTHDARPGRGISKRTARVRFTVKTVQAEAGTWLADGEWAHVGEGDTVLDGGNPPSSWRLRGDGIELGDDSDHVVLVTGAALRAAPKTGVCHVTHDKGMYGPTKREICFDALGLVRYSEGNLHGPRQFRVVRAR